ncbi:MAG: putative porin [Verrucomicrobiota bacterium]
MPLPRAAGLALLLSTAALPAQSDITGKAAPEPAPAAETSGNTEEAPGTGDLKENHAPAASAPASAAGTRKAPAPAPAGSSESSPDNLNGPTDPPSSAALFPAAGTEEAPPDMSQNVTINLLKIFVQKGYLSQMEAVGLIRQAENEALAARSADKKKKAAAAEEEDEAMKVSYVPEVVRNQMREEVRAQVLKDLGASAPSGKNPAYVNILPTKENNFDIFGDIRLRYELVRFPDGNDNTGSFPNFNAINTGSPFDTAGQVFSPQRNVDQDRQRFRLRVRVGGEWQLTDGFSVGVRAATGENSSPVSTNQSMGAGGGNFSKYALWLDRAFIRYHTDFGGSKTSLEVLGGRFDNPFFATEAIYDDDLGFDGLSLKLKGSFGDRVSPFLTAGAFPIFNTDYNFSSNQPSKFDSSDKYLLGIQAGADFRLTDTLKLKLGVAYYDFDKVQGELSEPFIPLSSGDAGSTDGTRPSFAQYGNTYRPLRQIIPDASNNYGTSNQYQYFGLASKFTPLVVSGKLEYSGWDPAMIAVHGEYIKNTSFDRQEIDAVAVNNRGPMTTDSGGGTRPGAFEGDDTAWIAGLKVGRTAMAARGDWMLGANYRWIGSDAVVDGFNDSDFGLGGTNMKGWALTAGYSISRNASVSVQWFSADEIAGPPLKSDTLMLDFKIKF